MIHRRYMYCGILKGISIFALIENINPEQLVRQTKTNKTEKHNTT
jgi:hypothetical protein